MTWQALRWSKTHNRPHGAWAQHKASQNLASISIFILCHKANHALVNRRGQNTALAVFHLRHSRSAVSLFCFYGMALLV